MRRESESRIQNPEWEVREKGGIYDGVPRLPPTDLASVEADVVEVGRCPPVNFVHPLHEAGGISSGLHQIADAPYTKKG
jgi:hypothetical protein